MDFNLFKSSLKRTNLVVTISSLIFLLIGLIIALTIKDLDVKTYKLPITILIVMNYLFIALLTWVLNRSKAFISFTFLFVTYKYQENGTMVRKSKFQINWLVHLFVVGCLIFLYFIELTATIGAYENDWIEAARHNWWIVLILIGTNLILVEGSYSLTKQLFNHDEKLLKMMDHDEK